MALRFKQDEEFLRNITMGAAGSAAVARWLTNHHGHRVIELERYAMANKIWETKLKRMRVADLLCLDCGRRFEARAKSKLSIVMSHSTAENRAWDAGLRNEDVAVFTRWDDESQETVGIPQCFTVKALRDAEASHEKATSLSDPKAASQGSEVTRIWKATVADDPGTVVKISTDGHKVKVKVKWDSLDKLNGDRRVKKTQTFTLGSELPAFVYVAEGETFKGLDQFLLGVAEMASDLSCPGSSACAWNYEEDLSSDDVITRYVAVKAAGLWKNAGVVAHLREIAEHDRAEGDEGDRLRLEAWGSLARIDPDEWTPKVREVIDTGDASMRLEAVFILSELASESAVEALLDIAREPSRDPELRAAAVWGLGETGANRPDLLIEFIADAEDLVALHALAAIGKLPAELHDQLADDIGGRDDRKAASAMALLARQGREGARTLLAVATRSDMTEWALAGLGEMKPDVVRRAADGTLPNAVEELLAPMWATNTRSWLRASEQADPLSFIKRQTIRHAIA